MRAFPDAVYLLSATGGLLTTLTAMPLWRAWCRRTGLLDDPGHRKIHHQPIPLAGGLAVFTGLVVPLLIGGLTLLAGVFDEETTARFLHGLGRRGPQLLAVLAGALGMVGLGWLDDRHELKPGQKLAGQVLIALVVAVSGVRVTLFVPSVVASVALTVLWILVVTNAVNIMDNMNGLCAGLGVIGTFYFGLAAGLAGQYLVTAMALLTCGALLGFLPFNFPKASSFLGDSGSHLVGYLLAVLAILPDFYSSTHPVWWAVLTPLCVLAVPLGDMLAVIWIRRRLGKPFYVGDTNHLSHRLVRRGLSQPRAVLLIWLLATLAGAVPFL
ncbi:MAG: undecaprenyl/decaprenyl-phosphate alpha-N-acetylglucosaminyl 1-phosphate transferase [Verrucomicrobiales bacterium]|nr:undecaprenyl/decaprenyl-phosphate alpha-N-acetylglucosaminyl 1-phosphate transferase [Verrucomicrobiales bacterium]